MTRQAWGAAARLARGAALLALVAGPSAAEAYEILDVDEAPKARRLKLGLSVSGRIGGTVEQLDAVTVDPDGAAWDPGAMAWGQAAASLELEARWDAALPVIAHFEAEGYAYTGQLLGEVELEGIDLPATELDDHYAKTVFGRLSLGPILTVGGGIASTTWGMGLLANGGRRATDWRADAARFANPYRGDTNLRVLVATGPWTDARVSLFGFADEVLEDDGLRPGDTATQGGGGVRIGDPKGISGGVYIVQRTQEAADGASLEATALDVAGKAVIDMSGGRFILEGELAFLSGETSLAPSFDYPVHEVRQLGVAARGQLDLGTLGIVIDALYASGDQDLSDRQQSGFKADRNYEMGLILYRALMAAQTGRAPITASDPELIGVPPDDIDRFPTRGGPTNTFAFFPRGYYRPFEGLEIYGGPLIAFADVPMVDPVNTNFNGGRARNALDGDPGPYLGTELDLGVRGRLKVSMLEVQLGLEGAVLIPGDAFQDADGLSPEPMFGGRAMLDVLF